MTVEQAKRIVLAKYPNAELEKSFDRYQVHFNRDECTGIFEKPSKAWLSAASKIQGEKKWVVGQFPFLFFRQA